MFIDTNYLPVEPLTGPTPKDVWLTLVTWLRLCLTGPPRSHVVGTKFGVYLMLTTEYTDVCLLRTAIQLH